MSILIKGMKMPENCFLCPLSVMNGERLFCEVTHEEVLRHKVDGNCPLIEIPPHGDLIDRAALWVEINKICDRRDAGIISDLTCLQQILSALRHTPTIIPAEPLKEK